MSDDDLQLGQPWVTPLPPLTAEQRAQNSIEALNFIRYLKKRGSSVQRTDYVAKRAALVRQARARRAAREAFSTKLREFK
jgi:hypothetical protein